MATAATDPATTTTGVADPIVLRLEIGFAFDSYGFVELHASGAVTYAPTEPKYEQLLRSLMAGMRRSVDQTDDEVMRDMPNRFHSYRWARLVDETGAELLPDGTAVLEDVATINADADPMNRDWLHHPRPTDDIDKTPPPAPLAETR